jgi:isopentenyldiphosphate isomerase
MTAEYFDLYDALGIRTGARKRRDLVHRDGDWHRSISLWIARHDGRIVLQRRSSTKDTRPGLLTASVSGHYAAGEALTDVLREAREEIGVPAAAEMLAPLGVWRLDDIPAPGMVDREIQDVFLWPLELPLTQFDPDPLEVCGLAEIRAEDLDDLARGRIDAVPATYLGNGRAASPITVAAAEFVPQWQGYRRIARAALALASGRGPGERAPVQ